MNKIKYILVLFFAVLAVRPVFASHIAVRSQINQGKVMLRWAASDASSWRLLNRYGVRLERVSYLIDGKLLDRPDTVVLAECLRPDTAEAFKQVVMQYEFGAIIAQAVFGERFVVGGASGSYDAANIIAMSEEHQQRFVFALYAADLCFPAALAAGWGFVDSTTTERTKSLYRVVPLAPNKEVIIETGSLLVDTERKPKLIPPLHVRGEFADGSVMLRWDFRVLEYLYNAYHIERSEDGVHFQSISPIPITKLSGTNPTDGEISYTDSIHNGVTYHYRIAGLTPFGSQGAYSDTVSGMGVGELRAAPFITQAIPKGTHQALVEWAIDSLDAPLIAHFSIERSADNKEGSFKEVLPKIGTATRQVTLSGLGSTNYLTVVAHSLSGKTKRSFSTLVQMIDTLPPMPPTGLSAIVDTMGVVRLQWLPNTEMDLCGYRVFRAQTKGEEMMSLNDVAISRTGFTDTVDLKSLNTSAYYAVAALDERYNCSAMSEVVQLEKPEKIQPTPPLISQIKVENGKNIIYWVHGSELTLSGFEIFRKKGAAQTFTLLSTTTMVDSCEDSLVENDTLYTYRVVGVTRGGLRSVPSLDYPVRAVHKSAAFKSGAVVQFSLTTATQSVVIKWNSSSAEVVGINLYKKSAEGRYVMFKESLPPAATIEDKAITPGLAYHYMLVVRAANAAPITITKTITL